MVAEAAASSTDEVLLRSPPYRPGTVLSPTKVAFVFNCGGIGDFINWIPAIQHAIETNPHLCGYITTFDFFSELAHLWLDQYAPRFEVLDLTRAELADEPRLRGIPSFLQRPDQLANASGFHLMHLGFVIYNQQSWVPKNRACLPEITASAATTKVITEDYGVILPFATATNRQLTAEAVNEVSRWMLSRGLKPVFLGKSDMSKDHKAEAAPGIDWSLGINLADQTSLLESASIMARASVVIGLDSGMLHLACCTSAPVVFALTTMDPSLRVPPRKPNYKTAVVVPTEKLPCRFCQTTMKFLIGHDFKKCLYEDNLCTTLITGRALIEAAESLLKEEA